jgi:hypothetical protein
VVGHVSPPPPHAIAQQWFAKGLKTSSHHITSVAIVTVSRRFQPLRFDQKPEKEIFYNHSSVSFHY